MIFSFAIIGMGMAATAQTANSYESISIAQGLSQGMVFDILQDREGFIWIATKNGLNRYDGYNFTVFTNDPYNIHSLSSNTIVKLSEDSKGRIWAGTENAGLNMYDKRTGKFYRIAHNPSDPASLSGNAVRSSVIEMPDGRILAAAEDAGFNIIELTNDFLKKRAPPIITRMTLPNGAQVFGMGKDKDGNIWIGGMDRIVYKFDPLKNSFTKLNNGKFFYSGYINSDGNLWINSNLFLSDGNEIHPLFDISNTPAGNIILNPKTDLWLNFHGEISYYDISRWEPGKSVQWNKGLPSAISKFLLYPFILDHSGMLWAGTMGYGLHKYNTASSKFKIQASGFSVRFIVPGKTDDIFLGAYPYDWRRLKKDSAEKNPFTKIIPAKQIDNLIISSTGDYWIRSDNMGLFKYNPSSQKLTAYPAVNYYAGWGDKQPMLEDSKRNIWFPGLGGMFTLVHEATDKIDSFSINTDAAKPIPPKAISTALYEDNKGIFWIGTEGGFAKVVFDNNKNTDPVITWYHNNSNDRNSLNYNHVSCFMDDPAEPNNYLWICTKGGGLNRLDKNNGDFLHLTSKEGLPNDVVYGILADNAGNIWGSTNKGIFCLTAMKDNQWNFRNFTKADGLQDDEFNTGAYAKLSNGNLAFGGVNGLNIFTPKEVLTTGFIPNVFITHMMVNNQSVLPEDNSGILESSIEQTKSITLNHLQDILTLEFSSLDFTAPDQNKYRYQLVGIDKDWVESGNRRSATYLHLPSGKYTFKMQGSNSQGIWSDKMAEMEITVLPPWWRSWWAYLFYTAILIFIVRAYFKFSINRAKLKSQLQFEQQETKRAKELELMRTQLYTNITHEFRTPLTVILGMAQQVASKPDEHLKGGTDMIIRNGQSLLKLVNEMLDLSKLQSGKMELQVVEGDMITFLRYIVESFHSLAESQKKQLHFLTEMDSLNARYDPEKLRQIISNLLSNALKFTPERGNIYISVNESVWKGKASASSLVIKIKDTGIGIPENKLPFIFDRFYQLDNSHTRTTDGTGIGLSLTKELVKLMEGEITVKSPPAGANKGSEFTVVLPIKKLTAGNADIISNNTLPSGLNDIYAPVLPGIEQSHKEFTIENTNDKKALILLVEDNADVVAYTASCLPDYRLAVGKDGREGFDIATEIIPDLIVTDVMMPFIDGFEMCRKLRNDEHTSHIPIIMLTAKADFESKMGGLMQGADVYLEKPFNKEELLVRIKKLLEMRKNLQQFYLKKAGLAEKSLSINETAITPHEPVADMKTEDAFVRKVREVVERHLSDTNFSVEQLCKHIFMSHSQLHRKLDALTGCSPNKFIRMIRLNNAKELLTNNNETIASIALDCGYIDAGYFSRVFKQEYGVTPQEWRTSSKVVS